MNYDDLWLLDPQSGRTEKVSLVLLKFKMWLPAVEL